MLYLFLPFYLLSKLLFFCVNEQTKTFPSNRIKYGTCNERIPNPNAMKMNWVQFNFNILIESVSLLLISMYTYIYACGLVWMMPKCIVAKQKQQNQIVASMSWTNISGETSDWNSLICVYMLEIVLECRLVGRYLPILMHSVVRPSAINQTTLMQDRNPQHQSIHKHAHVDGNAASLPEDSFGWTQLSKKKQIPQKWAVVCSVFAVL